MTNQKIRSEDIQLARLVLGGMLDDQTEIPEDMKKALAWNTSVDLDYIQHLVTRMREEGTLPEEQHRYLARGMYDEWTEGDERDNMPDAIFNEFPTVDGIVQITAEEFKDILAYVASEYFG